MPALFSQLFQLLSQALCLLLHVTGGGTFPRALSAAQERQCLEEMAQGSQAARQKLIEHNLRLVAHIIKKYYASQNDQEDLISIGNHRPYQGHRHLRTPPRASGFPSYASRCIENEILMFFRSGRKSAQGRVPQRAHRHRQGGQRPDHFRHHWPWTTPSSESIDTKMKSEKLYRFLQSSLTPPGAGGGVQALRAAGVCPPAPAGGGEAPGISRSYISRIEKKALEKLRQQFQQERLL